jgi:arginyl-tRNA synthetase
VYNVIDSRQSYTQDVVKQGVAAIAPDVGRDASVHLSYEMVALTVAACEELGIQLTDEDRSKPFIEMSGRKGIGVKADDLINRLELDALQEVTIRHPELPDEEKQSTAHAIAVGALRYFLLKFTRNTVIAFDFKEALSFEGETGPYCQYSAVRANSIFRKLDHGAAEEALNALEVANGADGESVSLAKFFDAEGSEEVWGLVTLASRLDEVVSLARTSAEPAHVAKYAFGLARAFNLFYHHHKIVTETDQMRKSILIIAADIARRQLTNALAILGISVPERM